MSISRSSQEKMPEFSLEYWSIFSSISGCGPFVLLPPMEPGLIEPVSWYLKIFVNF
jgi:hypothetical protein